MGKTLGVSIRFRTGGQQEYGQWLLSGLDVTLRISGIAIVLSLALGTLVAVLRLSKVRPLVWLAASFTEIFPQHTLAGTDFLVFGSYSVLPDAVNEWLYARDFRFACGVIALTVYTAAFIAEIGPASSPSPKTSSTPPRACGLSFLQAMAYVILPQAFRVIIPPLISQFLNLIKNSSLVMTIGRHGSDLHGPTNRGPHLPRFRGLHRVHADVSHDFLDRLLLRQPL